MFERPAFYFVVECRKVVVWRGFCCCSDHAYTRTLIAHPELRMLPLLVNGPVGRDNPLRMQAAS